jgi:hypothetical protein
MLLVFVISATPVERPHDKEVNQQAKKQKNKKENNKPGE